MATVLVVDDRPEHRKATRTLLERAGHEVLESGDGEEALACVRQRPPDLVLSDVLMAGMDGFTLCRQLQQDPALRHVPFIFMTGTFADPGYRAFAAEVGAFDVLQKPFSAQSLRAAVETALLRGSDHDATQRLAQLDQAAFHQRHVGVVSSKLEEKLGEIERANAQLRRSELRAREMLGGVVETISRMIEYRDPYTSGHERRVGELATEIGRELGYDGALLDGLRIGGHLHDVGKIALPTEILAKPGRLSEVETALVRSHAEIGHDILSGIDFPWRIGEIAWQHHERWDGSGYPRGLQGQEILREARIVAVADTIEAMATHRPYRPAVGMEKALEEIRSGRGVRYEEAPVDACLALFEQGRFEFR